VGASIRAENVHATRPPGHRCRSTISATVMTTAAARAKPNRGSKGLIRAGIS
jgi:hypothetical protein